MVDPAPTPVPSMSSSMSSAPWPYYPSTGALHVAILGVLVLLVVLVVLILLVKLRRGWLLDSRAPPGAAPGGAWVRLEGPRGPPRGYNQENIARVGKTFVYSPALSVGKAGEEVKGKDGAKSTSAESHDDGAKALTASSECVMCLVEYKDGDECRKLNACGHLFHVDCIDTWLRSNTSCPLCRTVLLSESEAAPEELPTSTAIGVPAAPQSHQEAPMGRVVVVGVRSIGPNGEASPLHRREGDAFVSIPIH